MAVDILIKYKDVASKLLYINDNAIRKTDINTPENTPRIVPFFDIKKPDKKDDIPKTTQVKRNRFSYVKSNLKTINAANATVNKKNPIHIRTTNINLKQFLIVSVLFKNILGNKKHPLLNTLHCIQQKVFLFFLIIQL